MKNVAFSAGLTKRAMTLGLLAAALLQGTAMAQPAPIKAGQFIDITGGGASAAEAAKQVGPREGRQRPDISSSSACVVTSLDTSAWPFFVFRAARSAGCPCSRSCSGRQLFVRVEQQLLQI